MKRIIMILAVVCLVVAMAVPALAVSNDVYVGTWTLKQNIDTSLPLGTFSVNWRTVDGSTGDSIKIYKTNIDYVYFALYFGSDRVCEFGWKNTGVSDSSPVYLPLSKNIRIYVDENSELYSWLLVNADYTEPFSCDGSCPFTDADGDGYCDNCGGFFTPPPPGPLVEVMTDLKEQNHLSQLLMQVVTMIPIGLGCWVGYKGLRKAWDLLHRTLHQA